MGGLETKKKRHYESCPVVQNSSKRLLRKPLTMMCCVDFEFGFSTYRPVFCLVASLWTGTGAGQDLSHVP